MNKILFTLLILINFPGFGQELPPVVNYGPNQYSAGNQNWMIAENDDHNLYFANSTGLLEFNGENWNLYPVPNNTIVRSVKILGDRIYTGAYMEAGYWEKNNFGKLEYTSLASLFRNKINDGEQFWQIEFLDGLVVFRSFGGIYFYDPARNTVIKMENPEGQPVSGMMQLGNELYFQMVGRGLYKLEKAAPELVIPYDQLKDRAIVHLYLLQDRLCFVSANSEFFRWNGEELEQYNIGLSRDLGYPNIFSALTLDDGSIILGTVGKGILQVNAGGELVNTFNQSNILMNNTVLYLFTDSSGNIWAGLDYGISMVDPDSSLRSFQDNKGEIGSVYASYLDNDNLYLGTNQGLYYKNKNAENFQIVEGTKGQVWFVDRVGDYIFCGHNNGTFIIEGARAKKISDRLGTWLVKQYDEQTYIQGHYNGISFLRNDDEGFYDLPMIPDFLHSSKFIEIDDQENVWVSNEHKGVFRMKFSDSLALLKSEMKNYQFEEESGITSSLFQLGDSLYYSSRENIYIYDRQHDSFSYNNGLNKLVRNLAPRISGKMISEHEAARLWGFTNEGIFYMEPARLSQEYNMEFINISQEFRNIAIGYENITRLENDEYLLGVSNGYIRFGLPVKEKSSDKIRLNEITVNKIDSRPEVVSQDHAGDFDFDHNNISFNFSVPVHDKYLKQVYSYRLLGLSPNWSAWSANSTASFKNLDFGDYVFEVKAKVGDLTTDSVNYEFTVARPYYLSNLAIAIYLLLLALIIFVVHLLYKRHHQKLVYENERALKMRNLEAEREIIKLKNEKLEQDMANKSRELAVSTMSLIKKNEFLTSIKDELKASKDSQKVKTVIKTIDKDISEEDNWNFFKKAFNNADKDFFKKIKSRHPDLTANDLKLCAYLRLNLSSKEIAPLLNISVKSVEIKRYRLRKKMELDRDTNLTEYILAL